MSECVSEGETRIAVEAEVLLGRVNEDVGLEEARAVQSDVSTRPQHPAREPNQSLVQRELRCSQVHSGADCSGMLRRS